MAFDILFSIFVELAVKTSKVHDVQTLLQGSLRDWDCPPEQRPSAYCYRPSGQLPLRVKISSQHFIYVRVCSVVLRLNLPSSLLNSPWGEGLLLVPFTGEETETEKEYSSPPLSEVFSEVSVAQSQPCSKDIKWKILDINHSWVVNCVPFWVPWWNIMSSCSIISGQDM